MSKATSKATEVRYDFTEAQLETLQPILGELRELQNRINFFLSHIVREAKLPAAAGGYQMQLEPGANKPYLLGTVAEGSK